MSLTFRYKKVRRPNNTEINSPSIPIILSGKEGKYRFIALLDSGADISVIPIEVAEVLGLELSGNKEEARGIGGKVPTIETKVNLEIGRGHENYNLTIPIKVILIENEDADYELPVLLGRAGFFDNFSITFNQKENKIILKKVIMQS